MAIELNKVLGCDTGALCRGARALRDMQLSVGFTQGSAVSKVALSWGTGAEPVTSYL